MQQEFADFSGTTEYQYAYKKSCWCYFFMRGAEAYFRRFKRRTPVYHNVADAQMWWIRGYDWAKNGWSSRKIADPTVFFAATMRGAHPGYAPTNDKELGWFTRLAFEYRKNGKKVEELYPNNLQQISDAYSVINQDEEAKMARQQLYQVKGTDIYGIQCGTNSDGKIVLEQKAPHEGLKAYDKSELEKVMPYTVRVIGQDIEGHYEAKKGQFMEGDIYLCSDGHSPYMIEIADVNTQKEQRPKLSDSFRIVRPLHKVERLSLATPAEETGPTTPSLAETPEA